MCSVVHLVAPKSWREVEPIGASWGLVDPSEALEVPGLRHQVLRRRFVSAETLDGKRYLLLRLRGGWATLNGQRVPAYYCENGGAWVVALRAGGGELDRPRVDWTDGWPWLEFGSSRLVCPVLAHARDWTWAWAPSYGPCIMYVRVGRPLSELREWLLEHVAEAWDSTDGSCFWRSRWDARSYLNVGDGLVQLGRSFHRANHQQVAADYRILMELAGGLMGELTFDVFDGDYYYFEAGGESCESLREYLHSQASLKRTHPWNDWVKIPPFEALGETRELSAARIGAALGWQVSTFEELSARLVSTPVPQLPRCIESTVYEEQFPEELRQQLAQAQPRVIVRWTLRA